MSLPVVLVASLFIGSQLVSPAHAQFTGTVCITASTTATTCPTSPPSLGPFTVGQTFSVGVFVSGSDAMGGYDIVVGADPAFVSPVSAALGTLIASPSLTSICINGTNQTGSCTTGYPNGPGVVEVTTIESSGSNECGGISPCSGMAFTINYKLVATPTTSLSYPTGPSCSVSSVSSPPNTCILVEDATGATVIPETIQGATVTQNVVGKDATTTAVSCTSPVVVGSATSCMAAVTDTATTGATNPTGTVTFSTSGSGSFTPSTSCNLINSGTNAATCTASYTPSAVGTGTHSIGAMYSGGTTHQTSTATAFALTVNPGPIGPSPVAGSYGENDPQATTVLTGSYTSTAGDIIVVVAGTMHGPVTFTSSMITDTMGNTYALITSNNDVGIWTATAKSPGSNTVTFTNSGLSTYYAISVEEYSHASLGTNVNTSGGSGLSPALTVSGAGSASWVVGGFISWRTSSISMVSPSVQRQSDVYPNLNINEGDLAGANIATLTASLSNSTSWYGAAVELRPAGSNPSPAGPVAVAGSSGENNVLGTTVSTGGYTSTVGDVIVVVAGTMHGPVTFMSSMVTDALGNTYALVASNSYVGIWTTTAKSSGSNTVTFTNSGLSTYYAISVEEYSHASVGTNVNTSSGGGTSLTVAVSGAGSASLVVGGFISWRTSSISMVSPSVQRQSDVNPNLNINEGDVAASSSTTLTGSLSASQSWYGAAIELKPGP